jgi:lysine 2,3-aminomutase
MTEPLITTVEGLPSAIAASVSLAERDYIEEIKQGGRLPFAVTPHFASLSRPEKDDPIRRQFFPDPREALPGPFALDDPLGEKLHCAVPRLVHQYPGRALLLTGGACAGYCRYCFRRVWLSSRPPFIKAGELEPISAYLSSHHELREILISGGDPLTADNERLEKLFLSLRQARPGISLRLCTRIPVTDPVRLCEKTISMFRQFHPLRMAIHLNHTRELSVQCRERLRACVRAGIPVLVQTVLLRGINDKPEDLTELFGNCLDLGLTPYYLFQMDLAPGTAHFRVPLEQGFDVYRRLTEIFTGTGLPAYVLDLPGGGGKIRLSKDVILGEKTTEMGQVYLFRDGNGKLWEYPKD